MGSEWSEFTVFDLVKEGVLEKPLDGNHGGIHPKSSDYVSEGIPFVMASDMIGGRVDTKNCKFISKEQAETLRKGFAKEGDVLLSHKATIGRTAIVEETADDYVMLTPQVTYYRVADRNRLHNGYLRYYFDSAPFQELFNQWAGGGSTRAYLGITGQLKLPIVVPPLPEQKAIAHILGSLDDKIELNRRMNATLEGMAQALFKSWFVDFDPVIDNALAAGNPIPDELAPRTEVRKKALANGTTQQGSVDHPTLSDPKSLFPDAFQFTEELGWIPEGWSEGTVGDLCDVRKGLSYKGKFLTDDTSKMPLINLGNFGGCGKFRSEKVKHYEGDFKDRHLVKSGQLMIANTDMTQDRVVLGSPIVVPEFHAAEVLFTHHTFAIDFRESHPEPLWKSYLYFVSQETEFRRRAEGFATGTTVLALPKDALLKCPIVLPNTETVSTFSAFAADIFKRQAKSRDQTTMLTQLRDTLLPKLISGELRIPEAEQLTKEALNV